ncbi:actin-related protein 2/3 complex subunit 3-like isoform X1 [Vespa mandarinia]|uniref:actin-related protein 2/3 complex subunit 3-like isoform X1 n=1 Tax=Vespa mandarinia TaxID=7446 RepID=UPI001612D46F|nr:actin-related protein 2/3 complex subunit 3-like isoform X1 [Vespa mandarinia]XP_046820421.1 actin-related protein 2/3 complex subunit 3-like isoform X1 [Vespa crabro]XP_047347695.1 actin-related protein 2/3 complex subunit 3-like isoform X1 [Vespa velutina]
MEWEINSIAYHSSFTESNATIGNMALLPIKTEFRGPAPPLNNKDIDIIDEALNFFKANVFFRTYEIKSEADRVLIYITLYITECLKRLQKCANQNQATSEMFSLAISKFDIPGDPGFPLNSVYAKPNTPAEADLMRQYLQQIRQETAARLVEKVYGKDGKPSKWWLCFAKKKFMDKSLSGPGQ